MLSPFFYIQAIFLSLRQIWVNKTRSFLTALGIIIGVASVTAVIAALAGLKGKILSEFEAFGASKLFILHDFPQEAQNRYGWNDVRMKEPELEAIAQHCPSIKALTPNTGDVCTVQFGTETQTGARITGVWPAWHEIENRDVVLGRRLMRTDVDNARQVCIINKKGVERLRLNRDPTNQHIIVDNRRFLVVGVLEDYQAGMFGGDFGPGGSDVELIIPFSTAVRMKDHPDFFFMIIAKAKTPPLAEEAKAEVRFVMRKIRGLQPGDPDTFRAESIQQFIDQFSVVASAITAIAGGIVSISLLVGGIGIMNIMLVSVSERTREIGLRKAVGATPAAILLQFLLEAITLSTVGGIIGVGIGELLAIGMSKLPGAELEQATVPWWAVVMSFGFCALVGVVFGMFPAVKASRLDPIDALRHE